MKTTNDYLEYKIRITADRKFVTLQQSSLFLADGSSRAKEITSYLQNFVLRIHRKPIRLIQFVFVHARNANKLPSSFAYNTTIPFYMLYVNSKPTITETKPTRTFTPKVSCTSSTTFTPKVSCTSSTTFTFTFYPASTSNLERRRSRYQTLNLNIPIFSIPIDLWKAFTYSIKNYLLPLNTKLFTTELEKPKQAVDSFLLWGNS